MDEYQIKKILPNKDLKEIKKLERYCERYGEDTPIKNILKDVKLRSPYNILRYKCPKCHGTGYLVEEYNAYPSGLPDSGWVYKAGYNYEVCNICNGYGYTEDEYVPQTKTEIIGYTKK